MGKKDKEAKLLEISFICPKNGNTYYRSAKDISWFSSESECDMCGSHGQVSCDFMCPNCNKSHTLELHNW